MAATVASPHSVAMAVPIVTTIRDESLESLENPENPESPETEASGAARAPVVPTAVEITETIAHETVVLIRREAGVGIEEREDGIGRHHHHHHPVGVLRYRR